MRRTRASCSNLCSAPRRAVWSTNLYVTSRHCSGRPRGAGNYRAATEVDPLMTQRPGPRAPSDEALSDLLGRQRFGTLATNRRSGHPHLTTMVYSWDPGGRGRAGAARDGPGGRKARGRGRVLRGVGRRAPDGHPAEGGPAVRHGAGHLTGRAARAAGAGRAGRSDRAPPAPGPEPPCPQSTPLRHSRTSR
ncbi:hypothetical protein SSIG_05866 [Streptomyces filamentosus NRRL 11379]|nr:hypothetical protein SSIG_05866 [Streptomyces filamentosus NRRL 11379]